MSLNLNIEKRHSFKLWNLFDIDTWKDFIYWEAVWKDFIVIWHWVDNNWIACKTEKLDNYNLYSHKNTLSLWHIWNFISYVQAFDFYLWTRTKALKTKESLSVETMLFLSTIINKQSYKFSYGRVWSDKIPDLEIKLPTKYNENWTLYIDSTKKYSEEWFMPDREFMENYIKWLHYKPITTNNKPWKYELKTNNWKGFRLWGLFEVQLSKWDIKLDNVDEWEIPLVSSWETNNWIVWYISENWDGKAKMFEWNKITIDMFCNIFYQPIKFYSVSHWRVNILIPKFKLTKYIWLFIATIIKKEQIKYSYWRAVYSDEAKNMIIKLPADSSWNPDREFMENYIKNLPYWDRI